MMVAGPLWIGFLVHIIAVALVVDALAGRLPRAYILAALAPYVMYYSVSMVEGARVEDLRAEYTAMNMEAQKAGHIKYDPNAHALVTPLPLAVEYEIPVTYEPRKQEPEGYMAKYLATGEYCNRLKEIGERTIVGTSYRNKQKNYCVFNIPEKPQQHLLEIKIEKEKTEDEKLHVTHYGLWLDGQFIKDYRSMFYLRLRDFPLFVSGCWLNSATPSWECEFGFTRKKVELDVWPGKNPMMEDEKDLVAMLLGIPKRGENALATFGGYAENNAVFDALFARRANEGPADFDEWGLRKNGPYQPELGLKDGYPSFIGFVDRGPKGGPFKEFIKAHEGQVVYLDITAKPNARRRGFTNYGVCPVQVDCKTGDDDRYDFRNEDGSWHNFEERGKFKGFFRVGAAERIQNKHRPEDKDTRTVLTVMSNP